jgi:hypothetical protein
LEDKLLPAYREMLGIFRRNMMLAQPETRPFFPALVEYVEIWDRYMANVIPFEVGARLGHNEATLYPFYDHLQQMHDKLRSRLASGNA